MAAGVPRKKKKESWVEYHDRLANLIVKAEEDNDTALSRRLQQRAGEVARDHPKVHDAPRRRHRVRGPGTYPFYQCLEDQRKRYKDEEKARGTCGQIRQDSKDRYPVYWKVREGEGPASNPVGTALGTAAFLAGNFAAQSAATSALAESIHEDARHPHAPVYPNATVHANPGFAGHNWASSPYIALEVIDPNNTHGAIFVVDTDLDIVDRFEGTDREALLERLDWDYPGVPIVGPFM